MATAREVGISSCGSDELLLPGSRSGTAFIGPNPARQVRPSVNTTRLVPIYYSGLRFRDRGRVKVRDREFSLRRVASELLANPKLSVTIGDRSRAGSGSVKVRLFMTPKTAAEPRP
jgi:hypothetical protein